jgi:hypothetical protein
MGWGMGNRIKNSVLGAFGYVVLVVAYLSCQSRNSDTATKSVASPETLEENPSEMEVADFLSQTDHSQLALGRVHGDLAECPGVIPKLKMGFDHRGPTLYRSALMAFLSQLGYLENEELILKQAQMLGLTHVKLAEDRAVDGDILILWNDKDVIVSFVGSKTKRDWIQNLKMGKTKSPSFGMVHRGFYEVYHGRRKRSDGVEDETMAAITKAGYWSPFWTSVDQAEASALDAARKAGKNKRLTIVGHSQGGSIATLFAADFGSRFALASEKGSDTNLSPESLVCSEIQASKHSRMEAFVFSAPRVGDSVFQKCVEKIWNGNIYKLSHTDDVISWTAPDQENAFTNAEGFAEYSAVYKTDFRSNVKTTDGSELLPKERRPGNSWKQVAGLASKLKLGGVIAKHGEITSDLFKTIDPTCTASFFMEPEKK